MIGRGCALLALLWPGIGSTLTLDMPANAVMRAETVAAQSTYDMPVGPWAAGTIPMTRGAGEVRQQAWRINAGGVTTQQILAPLRAQLLAQGFEVVFECETDGCGGFDFRFGSAVMGPPDMQINLGDFRYLSARRAAQDTLTPPELVSLWISQTGRAGHVQLTRAGPADGETGPTIATTGAAALTPATPQPLDDGAAALEPLADIASFVDRLETDGHVILSDLAFDSGSAQLAAGDYASLVALADYLRARPDRRVALVGHTDSSGSLEANIALSKRRAGSVLERLVTDYGINRQQLDAQGMGYLAPIAANITPQGREANRRVEVILTSIE